MRANRFVRQLRGTRFVSHAVAHWRGRALEETGARSERGDTLIEVLLALGILGIAGVALLAGFATAITSSGEHRNFASLDSSTRLAANTAIADVQQQAANAGTDPFNCSNSFTPSFPTLTGSFTVSAQVGYWNGTGFQQSPCVSYAPQQYTLTVSATSAGHSYSTVVTTVIYDPGTPPSPSNVTAPTQLVWIQAPKTGVAGISVSPQPAVAIEDANNNIVTGAFTAVSLTVSGPGTLSNTCFGAPTYGIVQFSGCSLSKAGSYTVQGVASGLTSTQVASVSVTAAPAAKLAFTSTALTSTASSSAGSSVTVTEEDALGNPTTAAATVTLATTSSGPSIFSTTKNGAALLAPPTVTIPAGQSSVTFFYGDQVAGSPTLTASAPGLAPDTQVETINPGSPSKLAITSSPFTAPNTGTATTPFTIALEDSFNNLTSTTSTTTVNLASSNTTGTFSAIATGSPTATSVKIAANSQSVKAYYGDTKSGSVTITVSGTSLTSASQVEQVVAAPTKLVFTTGPVSGNAGAAASLGPITVQEQTATSVPTTVGETVDLTSNANGTYIFNTTSGATAPTGATSVTIPSGQSSVTFFYGGTKSGTPTITAAATGLTSATQTETVNVGPVSAFSLSTPGTQTAGTQFSETLTAQDAGGNTVTAFTGANCITFSGPFNSPGGNAPTYPARGTCPSGSSSVTFSNGVGTAALTLFDAQTATLTATDGLIVGSTPSFTVNAATASSFSLSSPSPIAGTSFTEAISALDTYGNTATSYIGTKCLVFSGPSNSPNHTAPTYPARGTCGAGSSSITFSAGVSSASITLVDAQTTTLTATAGTITGTSSPFTVASGPVSSIAVANPGTQTAGTAFTATITATDSSGNAFTGTLIPTFSGPSNSPNGTAPSYPSSVVFTNGNATPSITLFDAQSTTLKMSSGGVSGTSTSFTVNATAAASLEATSGANQSANVNSAFTNKLVATATDSYGNPVSGVAVTFTAPNAGASATFASCASNPQAYICTQTTSATGTATSSTFTANGTNGTYTITTSASSLATTFVENNKGNQTIAFTSTAPTGATVGGATYTPAATATSGLAVAITVDSSSSSVCSIDGNGVVSFNAAGTCKLDSNQPGNAIWNAAGQVLQSITVGKGNQTITFTSTAPTSASVGGATYTAVATGGGSGNAVTFSSGSTSVCTSGGTNGSVFTFVGSGTCIVNANQLGNANYNAAPQVQQTFAVKKNQTISFTSTAPTGAAVGGATYTPAATATSGLAVTITVDSSSSSVCSIAAGVVSFNAAGTCTLDANQAGNGTYNAAPQVQQNLTVKNGQTVTFTSTSPAGAAVGGASYTPAATATSGLAVTITVDSSSSSVCSITAGVVSFNAAGTCTLDANQAGNGTYNAAPQVQQSFAVAKANQVITFTSTTPGNATVGGATYTASATGGGSGNAVTFSSGSTTVCTSGGTNGSVFTFVGSGTCVVNANQLGSANYNAASQTQQSFAVRKNQTVSFTSTAPSNATVGGSTYTPTATASSALAVTITVDSSSASVCSINVGGVVSFTGVGTCTLDANQAGNATWNPAPQVQQNMTVKSNQTISFTSAAPGNAAVGGTTYTPSATSTSGLAVTITVDSSSSAVCSINAGVVSFNAAGTCTLDANQAGNGTFNAASQIQQGVTVGKGSQVISFTSTVPSSATVGGATYTAAATGGASGNTVSFTSGSPTVCTSGGTNGSVFTFVGVGTCVVNANQLGNTNYNAATQTQQSFTVAKGTQTISFTSNAPNDATVGGSTYSVIATGGGSGNAVTFTSGSTSVCTSGGTNGSVFTFVGVGTCVVNANQLGNTNYNAAAQAQQSFAVVTLSVLSVNNTGSSFQRELTFSGTGASGVTTAVTVTVCNENVFPCPSSGGHTVATVATGSSPTNPWTTTNTGSGVLATGVQYFAQAKQGSTTSGVFPFVYNANEPAPETVALANGGVSRTVDSGDTATVTFSEPLDASTICAAWNNSGVQAVSDATITVANGSSDSISATSTSCGGGNFGTVSLGSGNYVSGTGTLTFTGSTVAWNPNNDTLTFTFGTQHTTGLVTVGTKVTAGFPGYTADPGMSDQSGNAVYTTQITSGTKSGF